MRDDPYSRIRGYRGTFPHMRDEPPYVFRHWAESMPPHTRDEPVPLVKADIVQLCSPHMRDEPVLCIDKDGNVPAHAG